MDKIVSKLKTLTTKTKELFVQIWQKLKPNFVGRKKYVWACFTTLTFVFVIILFSQNSKVENKKASLISTPNIEQKLADDKKPRMILEIIQDDSENINIIDSEKLDIELIEKKLSPKAEEVAKQAEAAQVKVYSNSEGILIAPSNPTEQDNNQIDEVNIQKPIEQNENLEADNTTVDEALNVSDNNNIQIEKENIAITDNASIALDDEDSEDDGGLIEATYEEELPEGEYLDVTEENLISTNKATSDKLKDMEINIARKPPYFGEMPVIVVVIDDMGISQRRTKDISSLQAPITSSFLTYSQNLEKQIEQARQSGHEIIVHIPMQAKSNIDAAPDVLTVDMSAAEIAVNFENMLDKFSNVSGVNNHMGSLFTERAEKLAPVMDVLRRRGLFFLDSKTSSKSVAKQVATDYAVPYAHRHVFLDNINEKEYVLKQLELTEKIANRNGYAVAIGHPKSATFLALKDWLPSLEEKNLKLLPLSEVVKVLNPHIFSAKIATSE